MQVVGRQRREAVDNKIISIARKRNAVKRANAERESSKTNGQKEYDVPAASNLNLPTSISQE